MVSTTASHATGRSRLSRIRDLAHWATVVALAVAAVLSFFSALSWFDHPYPGFQVRIDRAVELYLPPDSTGAQAGLLPGDRVLTADGRALTDPRALYAYVAAQPIGTPVRYTLERPMPSGEIRPLTRLIATQAFDGRRWASLFLALWLTGVCFLILGAAVSALKPGDPLARANWAFHMAGAAACLSIFDQSTHFLFPFQDPVKLLQWIVAVCFAHLALQFPRRYAFTAWALRLNMALGLGLAVLLVVSYQAGWAPFWVTFAHLGYIALAEVILLGNALWTSLSPKSTPREKGQGKILLLATLLSIVPALIVPQAHLLGAHVDLAGLENFALPLWPLAISYAIARHQLFEISPLVKRSLVYLLSAAVLTLLYVLATTVTETVIGSRTQLPGIVATVLVAFAFAPVRDGVKRWLDARFFRSPYRFNEVIAAFTRTAQETVDPQVLMQAYLQAIDRALAPTALAIFLESDGPRAAARLGEREPEGAMCQRLPLAVQDHVLGWVAVGPKKSELPYSESDRSLLGELTQLLAVWLNLFDRFEKARLQTQEIEALKRSEAMQGQFLNVVSHELKIPLSVIMSSLNILERSEAHLDAKTVRHHDRIRRNLSHLVGLVGDLLNAGQLQSGHFQLRRRTLDLETVARETLAEMSALAESKGHALSMSAASELPCVDGDEARLAQVFRNLIHNAIRYTPANGRIHLTLTSDGTLARCELRDNGPGIDAAALPHLFQRFSQAHAEAPDRDQGVGLGLFICKAIVEAHGGSLGVESRPGQGSTFWFTLPTARLAPSGADSSTTAGREG